MKPKLTLRDLFWLVLVVAIGCAVAVNAQHEITSYLMDIAIQVSLVAAACAAVGRYVPKASFSVGFAIGLLISVSLTQLREDSLEYMLRNWILPEGTNNAEFVISVALRFYVLSGGFLGGAVATMIARMSQNQPMPTNPYEPPYEELSG
jgi:hypothetical protein